MNPQDFTVDTYTNDTGGCSVIVTHTPTGMNEVCGDHTNPAANRNTAMARLHVRLLAMAVNTPGLHRDHP